MRAHERWNSDVRGSVVAGSSAAEEVLAVAAAAIVPGAVGFHLGAVFVVVVVWLAAAPVRKAATDGESVRAAAPERRAAVPQPTAFDGLIGAADVDVDPAEHRVGRRAQKRVLGGVVDLDERVHRSGARRA